MHKKIISLIVPIALSLIVTSCGTQKNISNNNYKNTIECIQLANNGDCIVITQVNTQNLDNVTEVAITFAINELLFNGISGSLNNRIKHIKPLIQDPNIMSSKQEYFKTFYEQGIYKNFAEIHDNITPTIIKTATGYKIRTTITLKKESLRHKLESDNIIKSLTTKLQ